jgi:predicted MFS family arabinose efflux permease
MAGSVGVGLVMKRFASAPLLVVVYALRMVAIAAFVASPQNGVALIVFAIAIGLTYMSALPPTAELLARSFGVERLSGLLGATMLVHQVGGFFGAWLGGVAVEHSGGYLPLWIADGALAMVAATLQLVLMRERRSPPRAPSGAPPARWACAAARGRQSA